MTNDARGRDRRTFLKDIAVSSGALMFAGGAGELMAQQPKIDPKWKNQIGLELMSLGLNRPNNDPNEYMDDVRQVAEIGYKEIEPSDAYSHMEPKAYKALLDKYGLKMISTHSPANGGPNLEKELEGQALMGVKYTEIRYPAPAPPPRAAGAPGARGPGAGGGGGARKPLTAEAVKQSAAELNKSGLIVKKFGMKILVHNHSNEFDLLDDGRQTQYDVLLAETDPDLVTMQFDIGWAIVGGVNAIDVMTKHPGRFELWHVKDAQGMRLMDPKLTPSERQRAARICPIGVGEIDYRPIFAVAGVAGLKAFVIEQDGAGAWGDAMAACRVSYQNLYKMLS